MLPTVLYVLWDVLLAMTLLFVRHVLWDTIFRVQVVSCVLHFVPLVSQLLPVQSVWMGTISQHPISVRSVHLSYLAVIAATRLSVGVVVLLQAIL